MTSLTPLMKMMISKSVESHRLFARAPMLSIVHKKKRSHPNQGEKDKIEKLTKEQQISHTQALKRGEGYLKNGRKNPL